MIIRRARQSDLRDIASIHIESWKDAYAGVLPEEFLGGKIDRVFDLYWQEIVIQEEDIVLVAEEKSILGFIAVWCRPDPFIDNLHVTVSHRSKQVGSALMRAGAKELIQQGHQTAYLWVFEANTMAIRFYERLGGLKKEKALKSVFGYEVLSRKIEWDDISLALTK